MSREGCIWLPMQGEVEPMRAEEVSGGWVTVEGSELRNRLVEVRILTNRHWTNLCIQCGGGFPSIGDKHSRHNRKFCANKCRTAAYKARKTARAAGEGK